MGVGSGLCMYVVVQKFTFAISSPDEFLSSAVRTDTSLAAKLVRWSLSVRPAVMNSWGDMEPRSKIVAFHMMTE